MPESTCAISPIGALELTRKHGGRVQFVHVPNVSRADTRRRHSAGKRRRLNEADLLRAGEAILRALLVAAREVPRRRDAALTAIRSRSDSAATRPETRVAAIG